MSNTVHINFRSVPGYGTRVDDYLCAEVDRGNGEVAKYEVLIPHFDRLGGVVGKLAGILSENAVHDVRLCFRPNSVPNTETQRTIREAFEEAA